MSEVQLFHSVAERGFDSLEPIVPNGLTLLLRQVLLLGQAFHVVFLHGPQRPVVGQAADPFGRETRETAVQGPHDRLSLLADVGDRRRRGPAAGQPLEPDDAEGYASAVKANDGIGDSAHGRPVPATKVTDLERRTLPIDWQRGRHPVDLGRARERACPVPNGQRGFALRGR
jgi:hypothetical protein